MKDRKVLKDEKIQKLYLKALDKEIKKDDTAFLEAVKTEIHSDRNKTKSSDRVSFEMKHIYAEDKGRKLDFDIFSPKVQPKAKRPAIVFAHGGCWKFGSPSQFHYHANQLAEKYGFFAVSVDYRLSQEEKFPAGLSDVKCAVRWIRANAERLNIDTEKIAICGGSAGGHLSSMVALTPGEYEGDGGFNESSHVNAAILFNGEFDMWDLVEKGSLTEAMYLFMGENALESPDIYDELSSIQKDFSKAPPTLLLHGTKDTCVSHEQSVEYHEKMLSADRYSELELYKNRAHAWFNREHSREETYLRMEQFLVKQFNLKGK